MIDKRNTAPIGAQAACMEFGTPKEPVMSDPKFPKYLKILNRAKQGLQPNQGGTGRADGAGADEAVLKPCCQGKVHIAYRGVSDDRMYMSRDRSFNEIKFFRPNGLRVFCADCRRRMV
jgi:hypothetical protein